MSVLTARHRQIHLWMGVNKFIDGVFLIYMWDIFNSIGIEIHLDHEAFLAVSGCIFQPIRECI